MIIDIRDGIVCSQMRMEAPNIETGEIARASIYAVELRVKKVDGQLEIDRECWIRVPVNYQSDYPPNLVRRACLAGCSLITTNFIKASYAHIVVLEVIRH